MKLINYGLQLSQFIVIAVCGKYIYSKLKNIEGDVGSKNKELQKVIELLDSLNSQYSKLDSINTKLDNILNMIRQMDNIVNTVRGIDTNIVRQMELLCDVADTVKNTDTRMTRQTELLGNVANTVKNTDTSIMRQVEMLDNAISIIKETDASIAKQIELLNGISKDNTQGDNSYAAIIPIIQTTCSEIRNACTKIYGVNVDIKNALTNNGKLVNLDEFESSIKNVKYAIKQSQQQLSEFISRNLGVKELHIEDTQELYNKPHSGLLKVGETENAISHSELRDMAEELQPLCGLASFSIMTSSINAIGYLDINEKFILRAGSKIESELVSGCAIEVSELRNRYKNAISNYGKETVTNIDIKFDNDKIAAKFVSGGRSGASYIWRTAIGKSFADYMLDMKKHRVNIVHKGV